MNRRSHPLFHYPDAPLVRKHGPTGYVNYESYKEWLRDEFQFRCVYCLVREQWFPNGQAAFGVEHVWPKGLPSYAALACDYENLVYACNECNSLKRTEVILDPCLVALDEHVCIQTDATAEWYSREGSHFIQVLRLNDPDRVARRLRVMRLYDYFLGHSADPECQALLREFSGYPDDLPNLAALRPPGNTRPEGVADCHYPRRLEGRLPDVY